jgi:NitT/TauT family transport system permease protein
LDRPSWQFRSQLSAWGIPVLVASAVIGLWWLGVRALDIQAFLLPAPPDIVEAFCSEPAYLLRQTGVTLGETVAGFVIAALAAIAIASALAASRAVERAVLPLLVGVHSIPKVSLAPLLVVWLGFGAKPKIAMVVLICFFPIMLAAAAGLTATPAELGELAAALAATRWQTFFKIRFPWAVPQIFVGLKTGVTLAVIGAVVAEISSPNSGLGAVIVTAGASSDTPRAFAAIGLLALMSMGLFFSLVVLERRLLRWAPEKTV